MSAPIPAPFFLQSGVTQLAIYRWGESHADRPALLLTHGTGFCAPVWQGVAHALASQFAVYAIDRRGHGASSKPVDAYHFADFAEDVLHVLDGLQVQRAYAIGHSAGATDLLLAAVLHPDAFRCILAIEPTVMSPTAPRLRADLQGSHAERLESAVRRRSGFASFEDAFEHYRTRGIFRTWQPDLLRAYVRYGFEELADGSLSLRCTPELERAMLVHIFAAMEGSYRGDVRGNPFEALNRIHCPTCIATTEGSQQIFKDMSAIAKESIPNAAAHHFDGVGHSIAQVRPEWVVSAARRFWAESTG
jgi:pimeloyl-ACP methyl ester carboxylesterase